MKNILIALILTFSIHSFAQKGMYQRNDSVWLKTNNGTSVLIYPISAGGNVAFSSITGQPTDNANLLSALALKADITSLNSTTVGLGNCNNTSDANKPVSTATQTALDGKQSLRTMINLASNFSSTSTTVATITGWTFSVTSGNIYRIEVLGDYQSSATTTGGELGINLSGAATGTVKGFARGSVSAAQAATELSIPIRTFSGAGSVLITTGVSAINTPHFLHMLIDFTCTGSGTFNIQWGSEVGASAAQINAGSKLTYEILN